MCSYTTPVVVRKPDILCFACRNRFFASNIIVCGSCGALTCPCCAAHQEMIQLGTFIVSPEEVACVRASLVGRAN